MAVPVIKEYERDIVTPGPGLTPVTRLGKFRGFDPATGDAIIKTVTPFAILNPVVGGQPPVAGVMSGSLTSATQADCAVAYTDPGDGRPPVTTWHWYRDGFERGTTTEPTRTFSYTTVPNDSNAHTFFVRGESVDGLGDPSNLLSLTWGGTTVVAPTAPTGFARHNLTTTQVDFTWAETADSRVDKHGIFEGGVLKVDGLDPSALAYTWSASVSSSFGPPGTRHTNVGVARHIPDAGAPNDGWSPVSNTITFTVPAAQIQHDVVMGSTVNDEWTSAKADRYPLMAGCRTYAYADMVADLTATGARVLAVTYNTGPDGTGNIRQNSGVGGPATAQALEGFYYFSDGTPRTGLRDPVGGAEAHMALDNETDRGANPNSTYLNNQIAAYNAVHTLNPGGARRYPKASMWADFTHGNITNAATAAAFKTFAPYLDGFACSMYPPGRQTHTSPGTVNDNVVFSTYSSYIDGVITVLQDWMLTGGAAGGPSPVSMFATWEVGIPIDHPFRNSNIDGFSGEPTDLTNFSIRPRYLTGGVDSTGKDWTGFLQYVYDKLDAIGCVMREQLYWNQQTNPDIPNPFWHDQTGRAWDASPYPAPYGSQTGSGSTRANPDTEAAWLDWTPGRRLQTATGNQ